MANAPKPRRTPTAAGAPFAPAPWLVVLVLVAVTWLVHRNVLHESFALDDLILFQQAEGLRPWPVTLWRWLSGWAWFRMVVPVWGHEPFPYHVMSLVLHVVNAVLLQRLLRRAGASEVAAFLGSAGFALSRLHFPALLAATSIGELLALTFTLLAIRFASEVGRLALAVVSVLLAVSAKESVFLVPFAWVLVDASGSSWGTRLRRMAPVLGVGALAGVALLGSGLASGRLGGQAYTVSFGANLAENVARLFGWTVDFVDPIPDLHASTTGAASVVLPVVALALTAWALWRGSPLVRAGTAWWWLAVAPVLPLPGRTYLHYLYVPLAGVAMIVAGLVDGAFARRPAMTARSRWVVAAVLLVIGAAVTDVLLSTRLDLRMPNVDWPLDPVLRKSRIAAGSTEDVRRALGGTPAKVVILIPASISGALDLGTGRFREGASFKRYELEAVLDGGASLRARVPEAESVAFVHDFDAVHDGWRCFMSRSDARLVEMGTYPEAHRRIIQALLASGFAAAAVDYADQAIAARPDDLLLRELRDRAAASLPLAPQGTP